MTATPALDVKPATPALVQANKPIISKTMKIGGVVALAFTAIIVTLALLAATGTIPHIPTWIVKGLLITGGVFAVSDAVALHLIIKHYNRVKEERSNNERQLDLGHKRANQLIESAFGAPHENVKT